MGASRGWVHTWRPEANQLTGGAGLPAGYSVRTSLAVEAPFVALRGVWISSETISMSGFTASLCASAQRNANLGPLDAAGNIQTPTKLTFNNGGAPGLPPAPPGSVSAAGTIATGSGTNPNYIEKHYFSDWMNIQSLDRSDPGEVLPVIYAMTYYVNNSGVYFLNASQPAWATDPSTHNGRFISCNFRSAFDGVTNYLAYPSGATSETTGHFSIPAIQYLSQHRGISVAGIGDSIFGGQGSQSDAANGFRSWGILACERLSKITRPVSWTNFGVGGSTSNTHLQRTVDIVTGYTPDVLFIRSGTINDGASTIANASTGLYNALAAVQRCRSLGIIPIVTTITPSNQAGAFETVRQYINGVVRSWALDGILICDHDAVIRDPSNLSQILPAYKSGVDNIHFNNLGYERLADPAQALLSAIIDANF
jgi:lysophospholipase L1-like esterase